MISSSKRLSARLLCGVGAAAVLAFAGQARAEVRQFDIPSLSLGEALARFGAQSDLAVVTTTEITKAKNSQAVSGSVEPEIALAQLLAGTDLTYRREGDTFLIVRAGDPQSGSAAGDGADGTVEALIVTAQKREEDIQDVPIAISAFTQEQLERSQVAGGPDLMTQVPNMTFTKTNFSSYSIQLRGIGTQAISATVDPAVAVAFNNTPFIRNRFFEQEFYDLQRVEVLRGPQGTLYGRNATAGVVNIISQKPKLGTYEAKVSGDVANYSSTRIEGMLNVPLADEVAALRIAGAWTKREGYSTNEITGNPIDGRDLWSTRMSLRLAPTDGIDVNLIWEHFEEDDDRLRSGKQVCKRDVVEEIGGIAIPYLPTGGFDAYSEQTVFSQGCKPASMYADESYQAPNGYALPYYHPLSGLTFYSIPGFDPYQSVAQSRDLRVIESTFDPEYRAKADIVELQASVDLNDALTLSSETAYSSDRVFSFQDYNRFNTREGAFRTDFEPGDFGYRDNLIVDGEFCDPQLGCASRVVAGDVSTAKSVQFSQELRLASSFDGPFNFSLGANYLRYDTEDKYYVFINTITLFAAMRAPDVPAWDPGVSDNHECLRPDGPILPDPSGHYGVQPCTYIDPNPIGSLNDEGHNYFLSKNPYKLISYAVFGEAYYNITDNLKVTAGLRWTVDKKDAPRIPSWIAAADTVGYSVAEVVEQEWREPTGRLTIDWKPDLAFTDETLLYASYAHGYKAGGANPPRAGAVIIGGAPGVDVGDVFVNESALKPKTFDPEFIDAFELGSKNTFADGRVTLNLAAFYYDYEGYQISYIVDRSATNLNFDRKVWGLEIEADWRPLDNLRLGFKGGYENTEVADGSRAIDVMDRTAGHEGWILARPHPTLSSNCILPIEVVVWLDNQVHIPGGIGRGAASACEAAWLLHYDPYTVAPYTPFPFLSYPGYDPTTAPAEVNNGEGFFKDLSGNELPNAPHFTATLTADYTLPLPNDWLATLHTDLYYQSEAWTRIFNTEGYDKLKAYTNVNLAAIFTNEERGWKVMAYVKNVFDRDSITGAFLNSDDTGLTTNVFLTEPRLYGLRLTKEWSGGPWWTGANLAHTGPWPLTVELGGQVQRHDAPYETVAPSFADAFPDELDAISRSQNRDLDWGDGRSLTLTYRPGSGEWKIAAGVRYGRTNGTASPLRLEQESETACAFADKYAFLCPYGPDLFNENGYYLSQTNWARAKASTQEQHDFIDFSVGRDFSLGTVEHSLSLGVRFAKFQSTTKTEFLGTPDWYIPQGWFQKYETTHTDYEAKLRADREFEGAGPVLTWDGSADLVGSEQTGRLALDWGIGAGVLFGKQDTLIQGTQKTTFYKLLGIDSVGGYDTSAPGTPATVTVTPSEVYIPRSDDVTAPLLDLSLGLSYEAGRMKLGAGYRWERYFDVLDVGNGRRRGGDRTIDGPYFKLSVGFGG